MADPIPPYEPPEHTEATPPEGVGTWNPPRYFAPRYFAERYFQNKLGLVAGQATVDSDAAVQLSTSVTCNADAAALVAATASVDHDAAALVAITASVETDAAVTTTVSIDASLDGTASTSGLVATDADGVASAAMSAGVDLDVAASADRSVAPTADGALETSFLATADADATASVELNIAGSAGAAIEATIVVEVALDALVQTSGIIASLDVAASATITLDTSADTAVESEQPALTTTSDVAVAVTGSVATDADSVTLATVAVSADLDVFVTSIFFVTSDADAAAAQPVTVSVSADAYARAAQPVIPDAILSATNLTGTIGAIQEDPDDPDANWLTATSAVSPIDLLASFDTPPGTPDGVQNFRVLLRKTTGTPDPTVDIALYQSGSPVLTLVNDASVTSTSGQIIQAEWNSSDLGGTLDGSDVECRIVSMVGEASGPGELPAASATAGTLFSNATLAGTRDIALPTHAEGDLLVLVVLLRNTNHDQNFTGINTQGWTQGGGDGNEYGAGGDAVIGFGWKIGDGSETVVNITTAGGNGTDRIVARVYCITSLDGFANPPVQNISTLTSGSASPIDMPTISQVTANDLAVCVYGVSVNSTVGASTGESGGNWTEAVAESASTNGTIGFQRSSYSAASISGGTATLGTSGSWVAVGFTVVPGEVVTAVNTVEVGAVEWLGFFSLLDMQVSADADTAVLKTILDQLAAGMDAASLAAFSLASELDTAVATTSELIGALDGAASQLLQTSAQADAASQALGTAGISGDVAVLAEIAATTALDVLVQTAGILIVAAAAVQAERPVSLSSDAVAVLQGIVATTADAAVLAAQSLQTIVDAAVSLANIAAVADTDAWVARMEQLASDADALAEAARESVISGDVAVLRALTALASLDSAIAFEQLSVADLDIAAQAQITGSVEATAASQAADVTLSVDLDSLVFNFNPFLPPAGDPYRGYPGVEDRSTQAFYATRTYRATSENRTTLVPMRDRHAT